MEGGVKNTTNCYAKYGAKRDSYQFYYLILISLAPRKYFINLSPHLQKYRHFPVTKTADQIIIDMKS
jgi:hypothetical protein